MNKITKPSVYYEFKPGEKINNKFWSHSLIGRGSYGSVIRAYDIDNGKDVAIKVLKSGQGFTNIGKAEVQILDLIRKYNSNNRYSIIVHISTMIWKEHFCIVLPLYNYNLYYSIKKLRNGLGYNFATIRKIARQLLECLYFLQHPKLQIIHTDIKPDNIIFVNHRSTMIKLIDFGSAIKNPPTENNYCVQTVYYRSPEIIMNLPFSFPIDIWSVGCVLFELKSGKMLFDESGDHEILNRIIEVCGLPPQQMIIASRKSSIWFNNESDHIIYKDITNRKRFPPGRRNLDKILSSFSNMFPDESLQDYSHFLDLLHKMILYDQSRRISPLDALRHPFIQSNADYGYEIDTTDKLYHSSRGNLPTNLTISETDIKVDIDDYNLNIQEETHKNILQKSVSFRNLHKPSNIILNDTQYDELFKPIKE